MRKIILDYFFKISKSFEKSYFIFTAKRERETKWGELEGQKEKYEALEKPFKVSIDHGNNPNHDAL